VKKGCDSLVAEKTALPELAELAVLPTFRQLPGTEGLVKIVFDTPRDFQRYRQRSQQLCTTPVVAFCENSWRFLDERTLVTHFWLLKKE
jgi:hypothetical protein